MPIFPSVEWFEEVRQAVNGSRSFRALGNCDTTMGVKVEDRAFCLKFEAFACEEVSEVGVEGWGGWTSTWRCRTASGESSWRTSRPTAGRTETIA